jgi:hypothetical protein
MSYISDALAFLKEHNIELALALTILGVVYAAIRKIFGGIAQFSSSVRILWDRLKGRPTIPRQTLRIVPVGNSLYCNSAKWYNQPATFLSGTWHFTNVTDHPVYLAAAYIKSPRKARIHAERMPEYVLQPQAPQSIRVNFFPYPAVHREGKPFKATVVFVDHYDNKHVLKNILFKVPPHVLFPPK